MMDRSRRQFLKKIGLFSSSLLMLGFVPLAYTKTQIDDFSTFMTFSSLLIAQDQLHLEFGKLCWRYVTAHSMKQHIDAMHRFVQEQNPLARENMLTNDTDLKSIAYHTLSVWYKGDLSSINPTREEIKLAYLHSLQWAAIGIPARGVCVPNWSQPCTI